MEIRRIAFLILATLTLVSLAGCTRESGGLGPAPVSTDPVVFDDNFGAGVDFQAFLWSDYYALTQDPVGGLNGSNALKVNVPGPGSFAGGAFVCSEPRDLSGYNALTFWARASRPETFDIVGIGNDNTGTSKYMASWRNVELTTEWQKYVLPIPLPARLNLERGLFFFADDVGNATSGYEMWFDEIRYDTVSVISDPRPSMDDQQLTTFIGATVNITGTKVIFNVGGVDETIECMPGYFTFFSSNDTVVTVEDNEIRAVGSGTAVITAKLGDIDVEGEVTVEVVPTPPTAAPTPTLPPEDVICLYSDAPGYVNHPVDTWAAPWAWASQEVTDIEIDGDSAKVYTNMTSFVGIDFSSNVIDASAMTHFHMDIWVPEGNVFKVKLVDFGEDGAYGGAPDSEHELTFNESSTPPIVNKQWISLDIPLSDFVRLMSTEHLAQIILSGNTRTIFLDNVYFHK